VRFRVPHQRDQLVVARMAQFDGRDVHREDSAAAGFRRQRLAITATATTTSTSEIPIRVFIVIELMRRRRGLASTPNARPLT
jgi:hypothetical protein